MVRPRVRVRAGSLPVTRAEGEPRPGPWYLPISGGWLPANVGDTWNWWQRGYDVLPPTIRSAIVEACVSAYSQTVAMLPGDHWEGREDNGRDRITKSALSRIMRKPNTYQTISDFLLNTVRQLYLDGNAYALAVRNDRYEIAALHPMLSRQCSAQVAYNGEIFYNLAGNEIVERMVGGGEMIVPMRDVLHIRLHTPRHPLKGESPLLSAALDMSATDAMLQQQIAFYMNMARPSAVLSTDLVLDKDQVQALRERWNEQSRGLNAGGTPILTAGLKPHMLSAHAEDSQLAEILKFTEQHIALVFRVPMQILGIGGAPFGSTELLMQGWIATGLGFALNHVEEAFGRLFQLKGPPDEYLELDTSVLLRSAFKDRIEAMVRSVQGGIHAPNEARKHFELPKAKDGDEPRVQQQVVPLSAAEAIPASPGPPGMPPAEGIDASQGEDEQTAPPKEDRNVAKRQWSRLAAARELLTSADGYDRRRAS
jgi:HK97 family phage portal protein